MKREKISLIWLWLWVAIGCFFCVAGCESTSSGSGSSGIIGSYDLKFGVMAPTNTGMPQVVQDTRTIERIIDPGYAHGFTIRRKKGGQFMLSYEVRFPEPLQVEEQGLSNSGQFSEGGSVYTSVEDLVWDIGFQTFFFSPNDPLGTYELTIFIDGEPYETIEYEVIKPMLL